MPWLKIITPGSRFGRLTVLNENFPRNRGHLRYLCRCDCGTTRIVTGTRLRRGTKSCGCIQRELLSKQQKTHGMHKSPTYESWASMKSRVLNPRHAAHANYSGRGISICDRWMEFENFLSDMGERPEGKTLDRYPNNNGNYEPGNCRWATRKEQNNNWRHNIKIEFSGLNLTLSQWSEKTGIAHWKLYQRYRRAMSAQDILATPRSSTP